MGGSDLDKLLDAVNDDNVVVGITYENVLIVSKRLE